LSGGGSGLSGVVRISFLGFSTELDANYGSQTDDDCSMAFTGMENVGEATCVSEAYDIASGGSQFNVTFSRWPRQAKENNIHYHNGNPPLSDFSCDVSGMGVIGGDDDTKKCELFDVIASDTTEYDMCAGRGSCDHTSGLCYCQEGFSGEACTDTAYEVYTSNALPAFSVVASGTDYTGNVLEVKADKDRSSDFRLAYFTVDDLEVFSVRGDGLASAGAMLVTYGGMTIEQNGLTIDSGGLTVSDDPSTMNSDNPHRRVLTITADSQLFDQDVLRISAKRTTSRCVCVLFMYTYLIR
jgi:hypothetical protein